LEAAKRPDTDVSFKPTFKKARERTPQNRADFEPRTIALVQDVWEHDAAAPGEGRTAKHTPESTRVAVQALREAIDQVGVIPRASNYIPAGVRVVTIEQWRAYAYRMGISEADSSDAKRMAFNRAFKKATAKGLVKVWDSFVFLTS
jgi:hypothetical protein